MYAKEYRSFEWRFVSSARSFKMGYLQVCHTINQNLKWNSTILHSTLCCYQVSENLLSIYLDEYEDTPWDALKYLIAGINYGGHVTDDWDRRLLMTYITEYFCEDVINVPFFK